MLNNVYEVRSDKSLQKQKLYKKFLCSGFKNYKYYNKKFRSTAKICGGGKHYRF